jgi:DNA-binding protein HU-beta
MTKSEFIAKVAKKTELTKIDTEKTLNAVLDTIKDTLVAGNSIQFVGFGTFEAKERSAREGINPRTKEKIQIAAKKTPGFKAGKPLKDAVANR